MPEAYGFPDLLVPYVTFVRTLRERLHPRGVRDIRQAETAGGLKFLVDVGDRLGCDVYYGFYAEMYEFALFRSILRPGGVVVDVGANFGLYTISAAAAVGRTGRVVAFEPDPAAFELLTRNVEGNGLVNVECHPVCAGDEDAETDFFQMEESAFSGLSATGRANVRAKVRVPVRRLDSVLARSDAPLTAMKIDVEGHEYAVLRGARVTIRRSPDVTLMIEVSAKNLDSTRKTNFEGALAALYTEGFTGWLADAGPDGLRRVDRPAEAVDLSAANLFLVRRKGAAEAALRQAARALRLAASHDFRQAGDADDDALLRRDASDPYTGLGLHVALLRAVVRPWQEQTEALQARLRTLEREKARQP